VTYVDLLIAAGHLTEDDLREYNGQAAKPEKEREREREKVGV
jgi:hypothetical protein